VLLEAHHVKELIIQRSRTLKDLSAEFAGVQIFSHLLAATLRQHKTYQWIMETLRENQILYKWGFPIRMIILRNKATSMVHSAEEGNRLLQQWNLQPKSTKTGPLLDHTTTAPT
ncbi:Hypothetical predicted protein, partial [Pelobates cultripes]